MFRYQIHFDLRSSKFLNFCLFWVLFMLRFIVQLIIFTSFCSLRLIFIIWIILRFTFFVFFINEKVPFDICTIYNSLKTLRGFKFLSICDICYSRNDWIDSEIKSICNITLYNLRWNTKIIMTTLWNTLDLKSIFSINHIMGYTFSANLPVKCFLTFNFF